MYITITFEDKRFSFEGETNVTPEKFGYWALTTIVGKRREYLTKIKNKISLKVSILDKDRYNLMLLAWESLEDVYLLTEDGKEFNVSFPPSFPMNYTFDYEGKKFYDATINLEEVE